jgi:hypothetical protein
MDESLRFPRETNGQRPNRRFHRRNLGRFQGPDRRPRSPFFLRVQVEDRLYDHPDYTGSVICRPNDCVLSLTLKSSSLLINLLLPLQRTSIKLCGADTARMTADPSRQPFFFICSFIGSFPLKPPDQEHSETHPRDRQGCRRRLRQETEALASFSAYTSIESFECASCFPCRDG